MNKNFLPTLLVMSSLFAPAAFAAKLEKVKNLSSAPLEQLAAVAAKAKSITGLASYFVKVPTPANGRSKEVVLEQTLKQAMVAGVCSFFDEQINLSPSRSAHEAMSTLAEYNQGGDEKETKDLESALDLVLRKTTAQVFDGNASGNNTLGAVVGIYDSEHNQILVFGSSNCGSDD